MAKSPKTAMIMNNLIIQGVQMFQKVQEQTKVEDISSEFVSEIEEWIAELNDGMLCTPKTKTSKAKPLFSSYIIDKTCTKEITTVMHEIIADRRGKGSHYRLCYRTWNYHSFTISGSQKRVSICGWTIQL